MRPRVFIGLAGKPTRLAVSLKCLEIIKQSREWDKDHGWHGTQASLFLLSPVARYNASVG